MQIHCDHMEDTRCFRLKSITNEMIFNRLTKQDANNRRCRDIIAQKNSFRKHHGHKTKQNFTDIQEFSLE